MPEYSNPSAIVDIVVYCKVSNLLHCLIKRKGVGMDDIRLIKEQVSVAV